MISEMLKVNTTLSVLVLYGNEETVIICCSTRTRRFSAANNIGDEGAIMISEALRINPSLTALNLRGETHNEVVGAWQSKITPLLQVTELVLKEQTS